MKTSIKYFLFIVISGLILPAMIFSSCNKSDDKNIVSPGILLTAKQQAVVAASNDFGIRFLKKIEQDAGDSNYFVSPLSVSVALGMVYNGAAGNTREEMRQTLGFDGLTDIEINEAYHDLIEYLVVSDPAVLLKIANSIWHRHDFSVEPDFIQLNIDYFNALVTPLNFSNPSAPDIINQWVADNTNNKIREIIKQIDPLTMMILINAVYFKGDWKYQFEESNTLLSDFYLYNGTVVQADIMQQESDMDYYQNGTFQCISMPYGDGRYSMVIMLPVQGKEVADIIDEMTVDGWENWLDELSIQKALKIYLPKFKFEYEIRLNEILQEMGMPEAFIPEIADFSGINPLIPLHIDGVKHKTYVDVNEKGTEAAAVTSVTVGTTSVPPQFVANRPFLFIIREKYTGFIVFAGKVASPSY